MPAAKISKGGRGIVISNIRENEIVKACFNDLCTYKKKVRFSTGELSDNTGFFLLAPVY